MYCSKCGEKLPDDSKFCSKCGMSVVIEKTIDNNSNEANNKPATNKSIFIIAGLIIIAVVLIVGLLTGKDKKDDKTEIPEQTVIEEEPANPIVKETEEKPATAVVTEVEENSTEDIKLTDVEICEKAKEYYYMLNGELPPNVSIDDNGDGTVTIHLYEDTPDMTFTLDWYTVNRETGEGTDFNENSINIYKEPEIINYDGFYEAMDGSMTILIEQDDGDALIEISKDGEPLTNDCTADFAPGYMIFTGTDIQGRPITGTFTIDRKLGQDDKIEIKFRKCAYDDIEDGKPYAVNKVDFLASLGLNDSSNNMMNSNDDIYNMFGPDTIIITADDMEDNSNVQMLEYNSDGTIKSAEEYQQSELSGNYHFGESSFWVKQHYKGDMAPIYKMDDGRAGYGNKDLDKYFLGRAIYLTDTMSIFICPNTGLAFLFDNDKIVGKIVNYQAYWGKTYNFESASYNLRSNAEPHDLPAPVIEDNVPGFQTATWKLSGGGYFVLFGKNNLSEIYGEIEVTDKKYVSALQK